MRIPIEGIQQGLRELPPAMGHYVARVLRRTRGDVLLLFDPRIGIEALAEVCSVDGARVQVEVGVPFQAAVPQREVILLQAVGKGDKMDTVVQDATELGATRIFPVLTERTVVQPGSRSAARVERWRRIADSAARQCGRALAPVVEEIAPLLTVTSSVEAVLRLALVPWAEHAAGPLLLGERGSIAFLVGPEGGLTETEVRLLAEGGWLPASLGSTTLRTETVAAAVLGALLVLSVSER
ncbi:MAG: 16S rRNA (uracil(1498)-N(3))-methyltransferase [Polyangiaceae bacterium]|nr:16S rRNA (uracil(1498)-N(3))-methyltransferase [Polyangiaceae bacterium]